MDEDAAFDSGDLLEFSLGDDCGEGFSPLFGFDSWEGSFAAGFFSSDEDSLGFDSDLGEGDEPDLDGCDSLDDDDSGEDFSPLPDFDSWPDAFAAEFFSLGEDSLDFDADCEADDGLPLSEEDDSFAEPFSDDPGFEDSEELPDFGGSDSPDFSSGCEAC